MKPRTPCTHMVFYSPDTSLRKCWRQTKPANERIGKSRLIYPHSLLRFPLKAQFRPLYLLSENSRVILQLRPRNDKTVT